MLHKRSEIQNGRCYSIILEVRQTIQVAVGRLHRVRFIPGYYVYTGRASRGIESRVNRHLSKAKKIRWHIDYLTSARGIRITDAVIHDAKAEEECIVNQRIASYSDARYFAPGFGASDCMAGCTSHLVYFSKMPELRNHAI
jgi:sugar fermentation stimulation protein A